MVLRPIKLLRVFPWWAGCPGLCMMLAQPLSAKRNYECVTKRDHWERQKWPPLMKFGPSQKGALPLFLHANGELQDALVHMHPATRRIIRQTKRKHPLPRENPPCTKPLLVGVPASMYADASLGFARKRYTSSRIGLNLRDGRKDIAIRLAGTSSRESGAGRETPTQRGKVGFRVCYTRVTHIAAPIIYAVGSHD